MSISFSLISVMMEDWVNLKQKDRLLWDQVELSAMLTVSYERWARVVELTETHKLHDVLKWVMIYMIY